MCPKFIKEDGTHENTEQGWQEASPGLRLLPGLSSQPLCSRPIWLSCSKLGQREMAWNDPQEMNEFHMTHSQTQTPSPNLPTTLLSPNPTAATSFQTLRRYVQYTRRAMTWESMGVGGASLQHKNQSLEVQTALLSNQKQNWGGRWDTAGQRRARGRLPCAVMSLHQSHKMRWWSLLATLPFVMLLCVPGVTSN